MNTNIPIVLASASPRRAELLGRMGIEFDIIVCDQDETYDESLSPIQVAKYLAKLKATTVAKNANDSAIIGADTIVVVDNEILGKPSDNADATRMIKQIAGRWHQVITGICIIVNGRSMVKSVCTDVHFTNMTELEIDKYVKIGESLDKAGAYGVQGVAGMYIDSIAGDYYNVMGFPMSQVLAMMKELDIIDR